MNKGRLSAHSRISVFPAYTIIMIIPWLQNYIEQEQLLLLPHFQSPRYCVICVLSTVEPIPGDKFWSAGSYSNS